MGCRSLAPAKVLGGVGDDFGFALRRVDGNARIRRRNCTRGMVTKIMREQQS